MGKSHVSSLILCNYIKKEAEIRLLKQKSARRGSNPRPPPWQGGAPPLSHSRINYLTMPAFIYNAERKYYSTYNSINCQGVNLKKYIFLYENMKTPNYIQSID